MALTDFSDVFVAVHDSGINNVIKHIMRQRPALFNYGTAAVRARPSLLCEPISAAPGVTEKITWTAIPFYQANSPLQPSGLLGPVQIIGKSIPVKL